MPGYTQSQLDLTYDYARIPGTKNRLVQYRGPEFVGCVDYDPLIGVTFTANYHPSFWREQHYYKAQRLIAWLASNTDNPNFPSGRPLTGNDSIVIVGCAFNWTGEALMQLIPGLECVGVDLSNYVQQVKDLSPNARLIEAIQAAGYDHLLPNSIGEKLYQWFSTARPWAETIIHNTDLSKQNNLNTVRNSLNRGTITLGITEELLSDSNITQAELDAIAFAKSKWGIEIVNVINGLPSWG